MNSNVNTEKPTGNAKSGFLMIAQGMALNLAILAGQWWILCYLDDVKASVLEFFFFLFFMGTVALSLKLWFYAFITIFVSRMVDKD